MKIFILILTLFLTSQTFASKKSYLLDFKLFVNGEVICSPRMVVNEGQASSITSGDNLTENTFNVLTTEKELNGHKYLSMNLIVRHALKDGTKNMTLPASLLARIGEKKEITLSKDNKNGIIKLIVVTHQQTP